MPRANRWVPATIVVDPARRPIPGKYASRVEIADSEIRNLGWSWNFDIARISVSEDELMAIVEAKRSSTAVAASPYWLMITEGATLSRVMAFMEHEWLAVMSRLPVRSRQQSLFVVRLFGTLRGLD